MVRCVDLTVTNGITYNSLVDDLADDNTLNSSNIATLNSNAGAQADIAALDAQYASGWNTVSDVQMIDLLNSYLGTSLVDDDRLFEPNAPLDDSSVLEDFIMLFGDTWHEGEEDTQNVGIDANPLLANIGFTEGYTNTISNSDPTRTEEVYASDGQYRSFTGDIGDAIFTDRTLSINSQRADVGTWLTREVSPLSVPEPSTYAIWALGLFGFVMRRKTIKK